MHLAFLVNTIIPKHRFCSKAKLKNTERLIKRQTNARISLYFPFAESLPTIKLVATQSIEIGEEILLNYGEANQIYKQIELEQERFLKTNKTTRIMLNQPLEPTKRTKQVQQRQKIRK
jgi:hypothetical protein